MLADEINYNGPEDDEDTSRDIEDYPDPDPNSDPANIDWDDDDAAEEAVAAADY